MRPNLQFIEELKGAIPSLRRWARTISWSTETDFEDLVQLTLEYALKNHQKYALNTDMVKWINSICFNQNRNLIHKQRVQNKYFLNDDDADIAEPATQLQSLMLQDARKAIADLPIKQQEAFLLVCVQGKSYKEAAHILDVNMGTIKSRVSRARDIVSSAIEMGRNSERLSIPKTGI